MCRGIFIRSSIKKTLSLGSILSLTFLLPMASSFSQSRPNPKVITSLFPLQEFAKAVGGERVKAELLLPPGMEPHTWEPKPSDVGKISKADIFIYLGRPMELWVDDLLKSAKSDRLQVVEVSQGLPLLEADDPEPGGAGHSRGHPLSRKLDPHVWLDFSLDLKIVDKIAAAFSAKDPANASFYMANAEAFRSKLDALDRRYQQSLAKCRYRQIVHGGHSAFAYLAKRYGLQQIALYGLNPNAEPTPKKLAELIQATQKHRVKVIYFEEFINPKLAQVLAKEAGIGTLVLNPGANLTREQMKRKVTFLELMEKNLQNLCKGLECE